MSSTKLVVDGLTYRVDETETHRVEQLMSPVLETNRPGGPVPVGTTFGLHFRLLDFDGEPRIENRKVLLKIDGEEHEFDIVAGELLLSLDLGYVGTTTITASPEFMMLPVEIKVTA